MSKQLELKRLKEGTSCTTICKTEDYNADKIGLAFTSIADVVEEFVLVWTGDPDTGFADDPDYVDGREIEAPAWLKHCCKHRPVRVIQSAWEWDFSKARNLGIEHCRHEWIFVIDSDELMRPPFDQAVHALAREEDNALLYFFQVNMMNDDGSHNSTISGLRMFKNIPKHRYVGFIHNQLQFDRSLCGHINAVIEHHGASTIDTTARTARNEKFREKIEAHLRAHPDDIENMFNMVKTYSFDMRHDDVIYWGMQVWEKIKPENLSLPTQEEMENLVAYNRIGYMVGMSHVFLGEHEKGYEIARRMAKYHNSADVFFTAGNAAYMAGDFPNARLFFQRYMDRLPAETSGQEHTVNATAGSVEYVREKLAILERAKKYGPRPFSQLKETTGVPVRLTE